MNVTLNEAEWEALVSWLNGAPDYAAMFATRCPSLAQCMGLLEWMAQGRTHMAALKGLDAERLTQALAAREPKWCPICKAVTGRTLSRGACKPCKCAYQARRSRKPEQVENG